MDQVSSNLEMWELVVALLVNFVTALVIQRGWTRQQQSYAFVITAIIATLGKMYFSGELNNIEDPLVSIMTVVVAATAFYQGVFKPTGIAPTIEKGTNLTKGSKSAESR